MFYVTTPIYYVNDEPHLGHAYTTVLADVLARYHRLRGEEVFFLTGVDEHGQKVQNALKKRGVENPTVEQSQAYVDEMALRFQAAWARLEIRYDHFFRTTDPRHESVVQRVEQELWERGEIYRGSYEGWYCVPDERFWTEKDLVLNAEGGQVCPECARPVEKIVETNYFFRMSAYQEWLIEYIETHPDFIQPESRRNEVLGFLRKPLGDLCISRPAARLNWGIPLPFDPEYVTYVWFDALLNYVTAIGYPDDTGRFDSHWPEAVHLIGKDILTTHAVYWPTMLHAMGANPPKTIFAHGWWVFGGQKMGKSLGNAVKPLDLVDIYGVDGFRYFLLRDMTPGQDAAFDAERVAVRYATDLANNLGNLLQRVSAMIARYCAGKVPQPGEPTGEERALRAQVEALPGQVFDQVEVYAVQNALALCTDTLTAVNTYLERTAPWQRAKEKDEARVGAILYTAAEALRVVCVLLSPVMPGKMDEALIRLGCRREEGEEKLDWGGLHPGEEIHQGPALFPRIEA
jgi:methionyl-tRNA synthetase